MATSEVKKKKSQKQARGASCQYFLSFSSWRAHKINALHLHTKITIEKWAKIIKQIYLSELKFYYLKVESVTDVKRRNRWKRDREQNVRQNKWLRTNSRESFY